MSTDELDTYRRRLRIAANGDDANGERSGDATERGPRCAGGSEQGNGETLFQLTKCKIKNTNHSDRNPVRSCCDIHSKVATANDRNSVLPVRRVRL